MSEDWQLLRSCLLRAAALATAAAEASTTEEVRRGMSAAQAALMDAEFTLRRIERKRPLHQHEKSQLQESAQGGMYCAACGEDVPS
jgi:RNA polymerase-binding transcription factor DksA